MNNRDKILDFLNDNHIYFSEKGNNVKQGNVNIKCPLCTNDPSEHLGIQLKTGKWGCWRNTEHRGSNFVKLVMVLLNCPYKEAQHLFGSSTILLEDNNNFFDNINMLLNKSSTEEVCNKVGGSEKIKIDTCLFKKIKKRGSTNPYWSYLKRRGFSDTRWLYRVANVLCCNQAGSVWNGRIIFPVYYQKKLVTWIGRSIFKNEQLRYRDLRFRESVRYPKACIYNYDDAIIGGSTLFITEGVFDCLKMQYYCSHKYKIVSLFTKTFTQEQFYLLFKLSKKFKNVQILFDIDASEQACLLKKELNITSKIDAHVCALPEGYNDPGEFGNEAVNWLLKNINKSC